MLKSIKKIQNISEQEEFLYSKVFNKIKETESLFHKVLSDNSDLTYENFSSSMSKILDELHQDVNLETTDSKTLKKLQLFYRGSINYLFSHSLIGSRALSKPFGYPGDYVMLQTLYDNKTISNNKLGNYIDMFFLNDTLAKAVINRVEIMGDRIIKFINESNLKEINILNIASGSGFELKKIISNQFDKKVIYHCFDQEVASLSYISHNCCDKNKNVEVRLYKEDIKVFFRNWKSDKKFDFIYNIGLADYLPNNILGSLASESFASLNKDGVFVLAHKDYKLFSYHSIAWLYDWNFIHRSLDDYLPIINEKIGKEDSIWFESDKKVIFFSEHKK